MSTTVADAICQRLLDWNVTRVYGYPGDGINGLLGGFHRAEDRLKFTQVRHEEMAAFEATGHAKFSGEVGVCVATSGPGAIHLLNGLYDAKLDHQPVVAIVGQTYVGAMGGDYQQEVNLLQLFSDVASAYCQQVNSPEQVHHVIDRAMRIARDERTVTCIIVPADVQVMEAVEPPRASHTIHSGVGYWRGRRIPDRAQLQQAAEILNAGSRVAILVGQGARDATDAVIATAEILGAGIAKALLGKAVIPDDVPFCTGSIGMLGTKPSWDMMQECDTLLMIGSGFPYAEFLPKKGQCRAVQIDISGRMLSLRHPMELALEGDARDTLEELLPLLVRKQDRGWQESITKGVARWWELMDRRGEPEERASGLRPQGLFSSLSKVLPDNAMLTADSGSSAQWFAQNVRLRRGMMASLSGNLATMLPGVPYAIAAKFAHPERVAIAMVGDGAMQMGGMNEMLTAAKYCSQWSDPRLVVLVLNNRDLNMVTWEQRAMSAEPKFDASQIVPDFNYARYAELIGLTGIRVEHPADIEPAWRAALSATRPVIIDALVDPDEPPLPPHVTFEEAKSMMTAIAKDPSSGLTGAVNAVTSKLTEIGARS